MRKTNAFCVILFIGMFFSLNSQNSSEWIVANLLKTQSKEIDISGNPKLVDSKYGKAVSFNGIDDAIFLRDIPLKSLEAFTIEMIFKPATNGVFEQRILHIGEVSKDRMLLEIRAVDDVWYFDGFVASIPNKKALVDETLTHPLNKWYHVALVVTPKSLATYVNGKLELKEPFSFKPIESGESSIGVRLNKRSWFKGEIYKIKITSKQLTPYNFMSF